MTNRHADAIFPAMAEHHYLTDVMILLSAAVLIVASFRHLRISPVLGYLVAGALIGPYGFHIITHVERASAIGEIGVVLLLFLTGLELSLSRLREIRSYVLGFGSAQVLITGTCFGMIAKAMGLSSEASFIIGAGLAFSSTAIVLQICAERSEHCSQVGRVGLAVLLLQDFAVVPLLVLIPLLAEGNTESLMGAIGYASVKAILTMLGIFILARLLLRPFFRMVAATRSHELFVATTLMIVLGASMMTEMAGLSMALGAFIAGLMVAETEFQHQVEADVVPFKGLLLSLFFMTIGMSIDLDMVLARWPILLGLAAGLICLKGCVLFLMARAAGLRNGSAMHLGILLAQGSEFSFVLFGLAASGKLLAPDVVQFLMVTVSLSMAITPALDSLARKYVIRLDRMDRTPSPEEFAETADLDHHIIIVGFGRMGQTIVKLLDEERYSYVILDLDPREVSLGRRYHLPIYFGDVARPEVLKAVGAARADMIVLTYSGTARIQRTVQSIRAAFPHLRIVVRAEGEIQANALKSSGADIVVKEALETGLLLGGALLKARGVPEPEIRRAMDHLRDDFDSLVLEKV